MPPMHLRVAAEAILLFATRRRSLALAQSTAEEVSVRLVSAAMRLVLQTCLWLSALILAVSATWRSVSTHTVSLCLGAGRIDAHIFGCRTSSPRGIHAMHIFGCRTSSPMGIHAMQVFGFSKTSMRYSPAFQPNFLVAISAMLNDAPCPSQTSAVVLSVNSCLPCSVTAPLASSKAVSVQMPVPVR